MWYSKQFIDGVSLKELKKYAWTLTHMDNAWYLVEKTFKVKWMYLIIYVSLQNIAWN